MVFRKIKKHTAEYGLFYIIAMTIILGLKYYYSRAGSDELGWILAPTAWWVRLFSGIPFKKVPGIGFVNHDYRFVIAPACAGVNFMIITFSTLIFSFIHRIGSIRRSLLWIAVSLVFSYLFTIVVNSLRIILSIHLIGLDIYRGWITPDRIHMLEGTIVYLCSLLVIYSIVGELIKHLEPDKNKRCKPTNRSNSMNRMLYKYMPPLFCYFFITMGIPVLNRAYRENDARFIEYSVMVIAICLSVIVFLCFGFVLRKLFWKHQTYK